jgi:hypothetical protein
VASAWKFAKFFKERQVCHGLWQATFGQTRPVATVTSVSSSFFPFGRILPNGNKPSSHFRHSVLAEWRSYSAMAVASSVKDQREDGQCYGHVGRPPAGGGRIGGRTAPPPASKNVANWQTHFLL